MPLFRLAHEAAVRDARRRFSKKIITIFFLLKKKITIFFLFQRCLLVAMIFWV